MGVDITDIVNSKEMETEDFLGKTITVDSLNWIYQFLSTIRQFDGTPLKDSKDRITSHLSGLFYRNAKLISKGIDLVYVFDGKAPESKEETSKKRRELREKAKKEWKKAKKEGDYEKARKKSQQSSQVTDYIIKSSKQLLDLMGIPVIQAKGEGESLCAQIVKDGNAYAAASQDFDTLLFGCPRLIRNLNISGRKKRKGSYITINPEMIFLKSVLDDLSLDRKQLITLGILVGTDFNPGGIKGIGPKKGLKMVKQNSFKEIKKEVDWTFDIPMDELFEFFYKKDKTDYKIQDQQLEREKLIEFLCDEHDFSLDRIESSLEKMENSNSQQSLSSFTK